MKKVKFAFPPIYAMKFKDKYGNECIQLLQPKRCDVDTKILEYDKNGVKGYLIKEIENNISTLAITNSAKAPDKFDRIIRIKAFKKYGNIKKVASITDVKVKYWEKHPLLHGRTDKDTDLNKKSKEVLQSWCNCFSFREETRSKSGEVTQSGLRSPQLGAIHAVLAHWAVTHETATIVIPTGIGKTEIMISVLVKFQCKRLLIAVPTDALRTQIANKFLTLGILKNFGIVSENAHYPVVGILKHKLKTPKEVDEFFTKCNVVITTMNIAGQSKNQIQERIVYRCSHLFIDEAHHTEAPTWKEFKKRFKFKQRKILQLTATPFRNDGKHLDGKIIFNYPLRKAQEDKYYEKIDFKPVLEYNPRKWDDTIAKAAVSQLQKDLEKGYDHILMARVNSIKRAKEVFKIYDKYKRLNPVQIHTGIKSKRREYIRQQIIQKKARIVVCVDMLGEGFDLPELKIGAFHDIRKSLPITLQLVGRFTRSKSGLLGQATFIANKANVEVDEELRDLYARDADWNFLLSDKSKKMNKQQEDLWDFVKGFKNFPKEISLQNIIPAMSTVIYKTNTAEWHPKNFEEGLKNYEAFDKVFHDINYEKKTIIIITGEKIPLVWGRMKEIYDWNWTLYVVYWDNEQNLLFINSSNTNSYFQELAKAVAGDVELVRGNEVFRCFAGINRLRLNNVGLREQLGRLISYIMRMGSDIAPALSQAQKMNTVKTVLFGSGYEDGNKTSIGCSLKGRVWSRKRTNIEALTQWCRHIGKKILDRNINPEKVLEGTLIPEAITKRPLKLPIGIDWPEILYREVEANVSFKVGNDPEVYLYETDIKLVDPSEKGEIKFSISGEVLYVDFKLEFIASKSYKFKKLGTEVVTIQFGSTRATLADFFFEYPPTIWFADGSSLVGNIYTELKKQFAPYSIEKIKTYDWQGVNIKKESQGISKDLDSIQCRVIEILKEKDYSVIFDDDGPGEVADIVAVEDKNDVINVEIYHCKYSKGSDPGSRIGDLYEVCGQAQKSIHWIENPTELFSHMLRREPKKKKNREATRFEKGTPEQLEIMKEKSKILRPHLSITIVQPGLSRSKASSDQLELLSVTENHLMETWKIPFNVIASE